ncbi:unnamed protein product [Cylindrotheca closterium]|uniref:peptidylprolyl isomerase n=1 Tax=Cylindrotheca closterium TaxID=2856 RepID=A0AAD2FL17_9STRA|nr:unnamed protein product [Cylindrotheca closterium]
MNMLVAVLVLLSCLGPSTGLLHRKPPLPENTGTIVQQVSRRSAITAIPYSAAAVLFLSITDEAKAAGPNGLPLQTAASGLKWADAKMGSGQPVQNGASVSIDYSMASTVGRQPQIYTTKDKGTPYRWKLGDGSTIPGIEEAIIGTKDGEVPPMLPGGIRRVVIPAKLGYESILSESSPKCVEGQDIGPIPPKSNSDGGYQRWYQFYCNPRIPYQPDIVMDIKLYGKRTQ